VQRGSICHCDDSFRSDFQAPDQVANPLDQAEGLPRPRTRQNQQRAERGLDGLALTSGGNGRSNHSSAPRGPRSAQVAMVAAMSSWTSTLVRPLPFFTPKE